MACEEGNVGYRAQLVGTQLAHIKCCKGLVEALQIVCNIYRMNNLSNMYSIHHKFFSRMMQEGDKLLNHINKLKALIDLLTCLEVPYKM